MLPIVQTYTFFTFLEEEVDGQAFMDLTEDDIKSLGKKIGVIKKLCRLQKSVSCLINVHSEYRLDALFFGGRFLLQGHEVSDMLPFH